MPFKDFDKVKLSGFFRFIKMLVPYRMQWLSILILSGIAALLGLVNPYLTKLIIDKAIMNKDLKAFIALAITGGAVFVITGAVNALKQYLQKYLKVRIKFDLNKKFFRKMNRLSVGWAQGKSTGENIYKLSYDITRIEDLITNFLPQLAVFFIKLIVTFFIVFRLNWRIAVFSLCLVPFLSLPSYYFTKRRMIIWKKLVENSEKIFNVLQEIFSRMYLIKAFGKEVHAMRGYFRALIDNIRIDISSERLGIGSNFIASAMNKIIIGLIAFYGGYQVIKGQMTLGSLTAIMVYLGQLVAVQSGAISLFQMATLGLVSCQRVSDILNAEESVKERKDARRIVFKKGDIVFEKVSFGYVAGKPVLKDLNFSIMGDTYVGLIAHSGFGKTTLLNLIVRLYDPWQGEIFIDGSRVRDLKLQSLKEQVGMALQQPFLFNDTVGNNILYGKKDATGPEMIEAGKLSLVDDFVKNLPNGYETIIGENACRISEGQKQKISIARALIKKPKVLILDEAMSSMDSESEEKIIKNIKDIREISKIIIVSHRLSAVKNTDNVYFFSRDGRVVVDVCEKLVRENEEFAGLFSGQGQGYKEFSLA